MTTWKENMFTPRTGELFLFNRADYFHKSTIESHIIDLEDIILENNFKVFLSFYFTVFKLKDHLLLLVDRGPDNTWKGSLSNIIEYGMLWKKMKFQLLAVTGYAPEASAFNPIERAFSSKTMEITGMTLSDQLDGTQINKNSSVV